MVSRNCPQFRLMIFPTKLGLPSESLEIPPKHITKGRGLCIGRGGGVIPAGGLGFPTSCVGAVGPSVPGGAPGGAPAGADGPLRWPGFRGQHGLRAIQGDGVAQLPANLASACRRILPNCGRTDFSQVPLPFAYPLVESAWRSSCGLSYVSP